MYDNVLSATQFFYLSNFFSQFINFEYFILNKINILLKTYSPKYISNTFFVIIKMCAPLIVRYLRQNTFRHNMYFFSDEKLSFVTISILSATNFKFCDKGRDYQEIGYKSQYFAFKEFFPNVHQILIKRIILVL